MADTTTVSETKKQLAADSYSDLLFPAITSTNIHPTGVASFTIRWPHLVINGRHTGGAKRIDITQWTLIVPLCFRNPFLSEGLGGYNQRHQHPESE